MTIKQLKKIIEFMDDDGLVLARDRDCINLEMVDIVKHPFPYADSRNNGILYHNSIETVYGGEDVPNSWKNRQAIIFCDND